MTARILPSAARGEVQAPPSKSDAHRLLICAGLAAGESTIRGVAPSQDMLATMDCLRALGAQVNYADETARICGIGGRFPREAVLPCRECGSTLRFFVPIVLLGGGSYTLTGSETLLSRPLTVYEDVCRSCGIGFDKGKDYLQISGKLTAGSYTVSGNVSSQFISGLCFALPLAEGGSSIEIVPPVESRPYIDMTLSALERFGVRAQWQDTHTIRIAGRQTYFPRDAQAEGDCSNAAFLDALNVLGGDLRVLGVPVQTLQADRVYPQLFALLRGGTPTIDLSDCPDLGPVCMALAAALHGAVFTGTRRLRIKESDRCAAMAEELAKFGIASLVGEDTMTVFASALQKPSVPLDGHHDHRIVMALSLLLTKTGGTIAGAQAVQKSYPAFFEILRESGIEVQTEHGMDS